MATPNAASYSSAALDWLAAPGPGQILAVGRATAATASRLAGLGSQVVLLEKSRAATKEARRRHRQVFSVCAAAEAMPFVPASFDQVVVIQGLHLLPAVPSLKEFARVLRPGGQLNVMYTIRDDSVPWVRRLAAILRAYDPEAMTGGGEVASVEAISDCDHFPTAEHRRFRRWVPITRDGMLELVRRSPALSALPEADLSSLLTQVGQLYDSSARHPEPLLLPYSVLCWRWQVDHSELSAALRLPGEGLQINL